MQTLSELHVLEAELYDGEFYFKANTTDSHRELGALYVYHIEHDEVTKISDKMVQSFFVNQNGVYYVSAGYQMGLFEINREQNNQNIQLLPDRIDTVQLTDPGLADQIY